METATVQRTLFLDSTPLLGDGAALRARAEEEGYLFSNACCPPRTCCGSARTCSESSNGTAGGSPARDPTAAG